MKNTYQLLNNRGQDAYKANKLMADKLTTLEQHLDYEAIIQIAEIDDQDLLYLNFDNQALGESLCIVQCLFVHIQPASISTDTDTAEKSVMLQH